MRTVKANGGFTLLEVVISIAALSLISVFILQMFMASSTLNERAKNADIALTRAVAEIEGLKKHSAFADYINEAISRAEHTSDTGGETLLFYYDERWNAISPGEGSKAAFNLQMDLVPAEGGSGLFDVSVSVCEAGKDNPLAELETKKYFPEKPVAVMGP